MDILPPKKITNYKQGGHYNILINPDHPKMIRLPGKLPVLAYLCVCMGIFMIAAAFWQMLT